MIVWRHQSQLHLFTLCKFLCSDFDVSSFGFIAFTKVVMWQLAFLWLWGKQLEQKNSFNEMPHPHYMTLLAGVVQFNVYFWQRQTEYVQGWRSFQLMLYYSGMCTSALWIHDYKLHELLDHLKKHLKSGLLMCVVGSQFCHCKWQFLCWKICFDENNWEVVYKY